MGGAYYIYEHWRLDKNVCFYVGKGQKRRAWNFFTPGSRNRWHIFLLRKLHPNGLVEVRFVEKDLDENRAFELERERIAYWRALGIRLVNLTDGGEGASGVKMSEETRRKLSVSNKGRKISPEHRAILSAALKGNKHAVGAVRSPEYLAALGARSLGRKASRETRLKQRLRKLGRKLSDEHKSKIRASVVDTYKDENVRKKCANSPEVIERIRLLNTGRKQTPEHIAKKVNAVLGQKRSEATRQLMRESAIRRETAKKASASFCEIGAA